MAAVTPVVSNNCRGTYSDDTVRIQQKCVASLDSSGDPVYACNTSKYFRVSCPKQNQRCSSLSGAWVSAITVCRQSL